MGITKSEKSMKIRINWGTGIAIFIVIFILAMVTLFWLSSRVDFDMVTDDYYIHGLKYQQDIESSQNLLRLGVEPDIQWGADALTIALPDYFQGKSVNGNVWIYRPSDARLDIRDTLIGQSWNIPGSRLAQGRYDIVLFWISEGVEYSFEKSIVYSTTRIQ